MRLASHIIVSQLIKYIFFMRVNRRMLSKTPYKLEARMPSKLIIWSSN